MTELDILMIMIRAIEHLLMCEMDDIMTKTDIKIRYTRCLEYEFPCN